MTIEHWADLENAITAFGEWDHTPIRYCFWIERSIGSAISAACIVGNRLEGEWEFWVEYNTLYLSRTPYEERDSKCVAGA